MAPTLVKALSILSFVSSAFTGVAASICDTPSECVPFEVDLTWGKAPGQDREAILTNGTLPGPPLKLKVGDCVDFVVNNKLSYVTSVHFHGIRQLDTPWADGAPGLSQVPIEAGESYMYQWTADHEGVYFYHAHYKGQMMDGLYGAILIEPADDSPKPFSAIDGGAVDKLEAAYEAIEPVFISDWTKFTFDEFFAVEQEANVDISCFDSIVLNGLGGTYCPGVPTLMANANPLTPQILNGSSLTAKGCIPASNPRLQGNFTRNLAALPPTMYDQCVPYEGKNYTHVVDPKEGWAALSFINAGGVLALQVSIDSHKLFIFEYNGNFIQPQIVDQVVVSTGDRVSFFVKLDQAPADYQIRVANSGINQVVSGFGVLKYEGGSGSAGVATQNLGGVNTTVVTKFAPPRAAPFNAPKVAAESDKTFTMEIKKNPQQPTESWAWTLTGVSAYDHSRDDVDPPLLFQNPSSIPESDLVLRTNHNDWVDLIIKIKGPLAQPHPMHKHANKFYVIGAGVGPFPYASVAEAQAAGLPFDFETAPYLDTYTSSPANGADAWLVIRYHADTPGAWFFHCHVQTHFSGGMALALLDGIDQFPVIPEDVGEVCPGNGTSNHGGCNGYDCNCNWGPDNGYGSGEPGDDGQYDGGNGSDNGSGSDDGSDDSSDDGSDKGSDNGDDGGFYTTTTGYPAATGSGSGTGYPAATYYPTSTDDAGVATFTGAASTLSTSATSVFGLLAVFFAVYA